MRSQVMISPITILQFPQKILKLVFGWNPIECCNWIFSQKNLDTQRNVVTEEFNQRYVNQPYGDCYIKTAAFGI